MNPHLSQLLMVLRDDFKPSRQHLLLPDLANTGTRRLEVTPESLAISQTFVFYKSAFLHPLVDLLPTVFDLALDAGHAIAPAGSS